MFIKKIANALKYFLNQPYVVSIICLFFLISSLLLGGNFIRIWSLNREMEKLISEVNHSRLDIAQLNAQLIQANDVHFIERLAKDRLDFAGEEDLVFVFSE